MLKILPNNVLLHINMEFHSLAIRNKQKFILAA